MLSAEDNELMCRCGPDTAMGGALRDCWLPVLLSADLPEPNSDPRHIELLGEHFVAFRSSDGRVGMLDEACCHRGASLLLGRVEGNGIRCIYHGWKFSVDGAVLETPNVPDLNFKKRLRARAHPVHEAGGLIWAYIGRAERRPDPPDWPWLAMPESNRLLTVHRARCNFVQVLEGLVDSSHLGVLHSNGMRASATTDLAFANQVSAMQFDLAPRIEVEDTDFGFHYAAIRAATTSSPGRARVRITAFVAPFTVLNPNGDVATLVVPENDSSCLFYHVFWDQHREIGREPLRSEHLQFVGLDPKTMGEYGIQATCSPQAPEPTRANRFHQDRTAMARGASFSGLPGLIEEDVAVSISAGPVRDRSRETLGVSDLAIGRLYKTLLRCARQSREGIETKALRIAAVRGLGTQGDIEDGQDWHALLTPHRSMRDPDSNANV